MKNYYNLLSCQIQLRKFWTFHLAAEHEHIVSVVKSEIQNAKKCKKLFENFEETASGIDESNTLCVEYSELYRVKCQVKLRYYVF